MPDTSPIKRSALIIDDEPSVSGVLQMLLIREGFAVEIASDGAEGLAKFEAGQFDLVVMDYEMPKIKGDRLAMLIKERVPRQPIIMTSAYGEMLRADGRSLIAVDLIVEKPFGIETLRAGIAQVFAKYAPEPAAALISPNQNHAESIRKQAQ